MYICDSIVHMKRVICTCCVGPEHDSTPPLLCDILSLLYNVRTHHLRNS